MPRLLVGHKRQIRFATTNIGGYGFLLSQNDSTFRAMTGWESTATASLVFLPPPFVGRVARRERSDTMCRVGPIGTAHRYVAPTPASASLWPTLPANGGG